MATLSPDSDQALFHYSVVAFLLIGPPTFICLRFLQAPYGKHHRPGWGPNLPASLAWFLMESPTLWLTLLLYPLGRHASHLRPISLILPYLIHYFNRTILYPLRIKTAAAVFPVSVALMAFGFNVLNAYVQSRSVSNYVDYEADEWFWWRYAAGGAVFMWGMAANVRSDRELVRLKREGKGYRIPRGGWFEAVSCPNYMGEMAEWFGWALMTSSWAGLAFFLYTCANLVPRARANHLWYSQKFGPDYPRYRKAVIPFLY